MHLGRSESRRYSVVLEDMLVLGLEERVCDSSSGDGVAVVDGDCNVPPATAL